MGHSEGVAKMVAAEPKVVYDVCDERTTRNRAGFRSGWNLMLGLSWRLYWAL